MAKTKPNAPAEQAPDTNTDVVTNDPAAVNAAQDAPKTNKSVVPSKYAGRYKSGGAAYDAPLAVFIRAQCGEGDKFEFPAFFSLCRKNGITEEQVAKYEAQVATNANGTKGRARMTLANMLRAKARKDQKLLDLNGNEVEVLEPKVAASGAVKAAQEKAAAAGNADTAPAGSEAGPDPAPEAMASAE